MQRFYQPAEAFAGNYINSNDKKFTSQLSKVLRAKEGDRFIIFDGSGTEYLTQLVSLSPILAKFLIIDVKKSESELEREIILYPSLLKSDKFEWLLQKVTEIGVKKIVPVVSERSIVKEISSAKEIRYLEILKEATEQCGGSVIPVLGDVCGYEDAIRIASKDDGIKLIAWEKEKERSLTQVLPKVVSKVHIFIGPEGGYSENEIEFAIENKIKTVSLGKRILRAETAVIYVASLLSLHL